MNLWLEVGRTLVGSSVLHRDIGLINFGLDYVMRRKEVSFRGSFNVEIRDHLKSGSVSAVSLHKY